MTAKKNESEGRKPWEWPWQGQLLLFVLVIAAATLIFVFPPAFARLLGVSPIVEGGASWVAPYVALTAVLISGIFLFTTFRIDRGARFEARNVAREESCKVASEEMKRLRDDACLKELRKQATLSQAAAEAAAADAREAADEAAEGSDGEV